MKFPDQNHKISKQKADDYRNAFKKRFPGEIVRFAYDKKQVLEMLNQKDCTHLGVYFGVDEENKDQKVLVLTALSEEGKDIDGDVLEVGWPCPPWCM